MYWSRCVSLAGAVVALLGVDASLTARQAAGDDPASLLKAAGELRTARAAEWLRSSDPLRVAWGAWLARQDNQKALIPLLAGKVAEYRPAGGLALAPEEQGRHYALLVVLDALIRLGAEIPAEDAHKLFPEFPAQSLILLLRSKDDAKPALLDIFQRARANWHCLAAGNMLVKARAAELPALLLSRFTQHVTVSVYDPGHGGDFGGGGSECGFSLRRPKAGWPPVGLYHLTQSPNNIPWLTAAYLVGGETPVYYWRAERGNYDNPTDEPGGCDDGDRDSYRAQDIASMAKYECPEIRLDAYPHISLIWMDANQYTKELNQAVDKQRAGFFRAQSCLQMASLHGSGITTLQPHVEVVIRDERARQPVPLPPALKDDTTVVVRTAFTKPLY